MSKALIDAIIDGEEDIAALAKRASEIGATLGERLTAATKALAERILDNRISIEKAEKLYRLFYVELTLAGFAQVAHDVQDIVERNGSRIHVSADGVENLKGLAVIDKATKRARAEEKARGRKV